jgi:hypothetical protein
MPEPDKNQPRNPPSPERSKLPPALQGVRPPAPGQQVPPVRQSSAPPPTLPRPTIPAASRAPRAAPPPALGHPPRSSAPTPASASNRQHLADALSQTAWDAARAEDAAVIAPQPPVSALGLPRYIASRQRDPLRVRRTVIPILLTAGLLLAGAGTYLRLARASDTLSDMLPSWAPLVFIVLGVLSGLLGVVNVLSVRNALAAGRSPR